MEDLLWYCDNCDAHLNKQSGFNAKEEFWVCDECGFVNDVTEDNVFTEEELELAGKSYVTCPICYAHMEHDLFDDDRFTCPDCGLAGVFDYNEELLVPDDLPDLIVKRYKVRFIYSNGASEEDDVVFENYEDAENYALDLVSSDATGAEVLHLSDPFEYDGVVQHVEYEIIEFEEIEDIQ